MLDTEKEHKIKNQADESDAKEKNIKSEPIKQTLIVSRIQKFITLNIITDFLNNLFFSIFYKNRIFALSNNVNSAIKLKNQLTRLNFKNPNKFNPDINKITNNINKEIQKENAKSPSLTLHDVRGILILFQKA